MEKKLRELLENRGFGGDDIHDISECMALADVEGEPQGKTEWEAVAEDCGAAAPSEGEKPYATDVDMHRNRDSRVMLKHAPVSQSREFTEEEVKGIITKNTDYAEITRVINLYRPAAASPVSSLSEEQVRGLAYKLYDKVLELENGKDAGPRLYDYCIDPNHEDGFDETRIDNLLEPLVKLLNAALGKEEVRDTRSLPLGRFVEDDVRRNHAKEGKK